VEELAEQLTGQAEERAEEEPVAEELAARKPVGEQESGSGRCGSSG